MLGTSNYLASFTPSIAQVDQDQGASYSEMPGNVKILVAEDNPINQKLILRILASMGFKADVVENGLEVLEALKEKEYELVLMDIQMPVMDGMEATRQILTRCDHMNRPFIIAVTAFAGKGDKKKFLDIGMDDYISKPIDIQKFKECIHHWWRKKR